MPLYTLCPNYVNHSCNDNDDFVNILLSFCQTNGRKIVFDDKNKVVEAYKAMVDNQENLSLWLKFLTMKESNYEIVAIDFDDKLDQNYQLITSVASKTYDKNLACKTKQDYQELKALIEAEEIILLDKDELRQSFINSATTIIQQTSGNNSPIVGGKENTVGK